MARTFTGAREAAKQRAGELAGITVSLHSCCTAAGCLCVDGMQEINEVQYPGYKRQAAPVAAGINLLQDDIESGIHNSATVIFPAYKGSYPKVITHVALWGADSVRFWLQPLRRALVLQPNDHVALCPGAIAAPPLNQWKEA